VILRFGLPPLSRQYRESILISPLVQLVSALMARARQQFHILGTVIPRYPCTVMGLIFAVREDLLRIMSETSKQLMNFGSDHSSAFGIV
jgi:hypothetical protein